MFAQWSGMRERSVYSGKLLIAQIRLSLWGGGGGVEWLLRIFTGETF